MINLINFIIRGSKASPKAIGYWLLRKLKARRSDKVLPGWQRWLGASSMAAALDHKSFDALIATMRSANPFPGLSDPAALRTALSAEAQNEIHIRAQCAMRREVDLLGSGPFTHGTPVDWTLDFKTGTRWSMQPSRQLPVNSLGKPSDIKVPWELSRLQWLLPVGQSYLLEGDEAHAIFSRAIIEDWMISNPVGRGPNWMCAMDVALRAISIIWLFHACKSSAAWRDIDFLERLIKSLILHAKFIDMNLEYADINGNHLTSDLAGLTVIGIALGGQGISSRWVDRSWRLLGEELPKQVSSDGVNFEASLPYHRLVAELFLLPALARRNVGLMVEPGYMARLVSMADFTNAATMPDGTVPVWGDADDGRALPLGTQALNDHRYLVEMLMTLQQPQTQPNHDEALWWLGVGNSPALTLPEAHSSAFTDSGVHIMRSNDDYIFIDAGPVGMAGRGGHGHNDCLSFEACLRGQTLIIDPGCYVYTSDWRARNRFRGTAVHNTPMIDDQEINRIPRDDWLWYLENDAVPEVRHWNTSDDADLLIASHSGYQRLGQPVTPVRSMMLQKNTHRLIVADHFEGNGAHSVRIPFTLAPGCRIQQSTPGMWQVTTGSAAFIIVVSDLENWQGEIGSAEFSPSYGVKQPVNALTFSRTGPLMPFGLAIMGAADAPANPAEWLKGALVDLANTHQVRA